MACRGFFDDSAAAEDATQETFLRRHQNIHNFQGGNFLGGSRGYPRMFASTSGGSAVRKWELTMNSCPEGALLGGDEHNARFAVDG